MASLCAGLLLLVLGLPLSVYPARAASKLPRCSETGDGVRKCKAHCVKLSDKPLCSCPPGYSIRAGTSTCVIGSTFWLNGCMDGEVCGFHGICENDICTCGEGFYPVGVCGKKKVSDVPPACYRSSNHCPLGVTCDHDKEEDCECEPGTFFVLDRCVPVKFTPPVGCDANSCPEPASCDVSGHCQCPAGYFAWGNSCVTHSFETKGKCNHHKCPKATGYCADDDTCACKQDRFADGHHCVKASFTLQEDGCTRRCTTSGTDACGPNAACACDGDGHQTCYCNPGFVEKHDNAGKCVPGSAMPYSEQTCHEAGEACKNGVCRSATGDGQHLRCYCAWGKAEDGTCNSASPSKRRSKHHWFARRDKHHNDRHHDA
nr:hypothetical protein BaRGS_027767 [Batillaria attramentaria]